MDLIDIQAFLTVAEERSFTRAARQLFVTPSAVSRRVKALERELGFALLVRDRRATELTPLGNALLPRARELVAGFESFVGLVRQLALEHPRPLIVGFPPLLHPMATSTLMDLLDSMVPPLRVQYRPFPNAELLHRLVGGDLDLALIHEHMHCPQIESVQVLSERVGVAVPANLVPMDRVEIALDDLTDLLYVTSENMSAPQFYRTIDMHVQRAGIVQRIELPHHELGTMLNLIIAGKAFAFTPLDQRAPGNRMFTDEAVEIRPIWDVELRLSTFIGWRTDAVEEDRRIRATAEELGRALAVPTEL